MRMLLILLAISSTPAPASADAPTWSPLRVYVECQTRGRTKACPAFLRGFVDATPVLDWAPRANADVWVMVNVTFDAQDDLVHLRYTGRRDGLPASYEVTARVDARADDDAQRAALRPTFDRGVAPFVGIAVPDALLVSLVAPPNGHERARPTTPWSVNLWAGGWGDWSEMFQSAHGWGGASVTRTTTSSRHWVMLSGGYRLSRQPPLVIDDEEVSLDSDSYNVQARAATTWNLGHHVAAGALARGGHEDSEGRYDRTTRAHGLVSYDWFASDDPRGNVLAVGYVAGYQLDRYHARNVLGETTAHFPTHGVLAQGSVRRDTVTYNVHASAMAMLFEPRTRYVLDVFPSVSWKLGDHVDLNLTVGVTKQAVPGPADLDATDFEEVTRSSYTDPLRLHTSFHLNVHWDHTNGARNNRLSLSRRLGSIGTL